MISIEELLLRLDKKVKFAGLVSSRTCTINTDAYDAYEICHDLIIEELELLKEDTARLG